MSNSPNSASLSMQSGITDISDLYVDAAGMREEYERRGSEYAEANYQFDLLNDTLPSLLAHLTLQVKRRGAAKSTTDAEMIAKESPEYLEQINARALAKREMLNAKYRADAQRIYGEFIRSNNTTHRELSKIR